MLAEEQHLVSLTEGFLKVFTKHLCLNVEALSSCLTHSRLIPEWCLERVEDALFGSLGNFQSSPLEGKNILFVSLNAPSTDGKLLEKNVQKIKQLVLSKLPTRVLLVVSSNLLHFLTGREFLEIAHIPVGFPFCTPNGIIDKTTWPVSIALAINKESMWVDPIDWSGFKEDLNIWSEQHCTDLKINSITDLKFSERLAPSHSPRACAHGTEGSTTVYQFFSLTPPRHENLKEMEMKGVPVHIAKLIYSISKHNPLLSIWEFFNQLRNILNYGPLISTKRLMTYLSLCSFTVIKYGNSAKD